MFNNNVAQTYNFQDASQEILIMLIGAFLLGALLTWLLSKLFSKDYSINNKDYRYQNQGNDEINTLRQSINTQPDATSEVRIVDKPTNPIKTGNTPDDLSKISGIDEAMQIKLKEMGISSFANLRDIKTKELIALQQSQQEHKKEIETWPRQASLAAKGDWHKLEEYQGFIQRVRTASKTLEQVKPQDTDELTKLIGINPEVESVLNKNEIYTFKQLSHMDNDSLKKHLLESEAPYVESETESWPHQAAMAEKGQWDELKIYQDFMHSDSDAESRITLASEGEKPSLKTESEKIKLASNITSINSIKEKKNSNEHTEINLSDHDDLKKIEGIGPKIEEVLNKGGIYTFSQLYKSDRTRLRKLLDDAGNQFRMHDPESWPHQAGMANRSEWNDLKTYQKSINKEQTLSKEKIKKSNLDDKTISKSHEYGEHNSDELKDDLRKIEGIGPKIQELLNNAGIHSFQELSKSSRDQIKALLNEAGPQFLMHEPESWPHQAKLAAKEEWKELEKYQDFLISGRE